MDATHFVNTTPDLNWCYLPTVTYIHNRKVRNQLGVAGKKHTNLLDHKFRHYKVSRRFEIVSLIVESKSRLHLKSSLWTRGKLRQCFRIWGVW